MKNDHNYHIQLNAWTYHQKKTTRTRARDLFPDAMKMSAHYFLKNIPFSTHMWSRLSSSVWQRNGSELIWGGQSVWQTRLGKLIIAHGYPHSAFVWDAPSVLANSDTLGRRVILKCKILCTQVTIDKFIYLAREQIIESKQVLLKNKGQVFKEGSLI